MSGRYAGSARLVYVSRSGERVQYLAPRILPEGATVAGPGATELLASEVHRLDLAAYRVLGNAELAWRIADANDAMNPFELCRRGGQPLRVPRPQL